MDQLQQLPTFARADRTRLRVFRDGQIFQKSVDEYLVARKRALVRSTYVDRAGNMTSQDCSLCDRDQQA